MIKVENLRKRFGSVEAVKGISFTAERGQIFGLLGPNGAGKTTTTRIILNISAADEGKVTIDGKSVGPEILDRVGYLPEERGLYQEQNVFDVLFYLATIKGISHTRAKVDIVRWLDRLDLVDAADRKVGNLSRGNQQKVQLLAAIAHDPDYVILDEPFSGLDPINQAAIRELILELKAAGKCIVLSSHRMELVESLCDYIYLLNRGEEVLSGPLDEIRRQESEGSILIESDGDLTFLSAWPMVYGMEYTRNGAILHLDEGADFNDFINELVQKAEIRKVERKEPNLKDLYLTAIKKHQVAK